MNANAGRLYGEGLCSVVDGEARQEFGEALRGFRRRRAMTQEDLADRAGLSSRAVRSLELAAVGRPRRKTVAILAEALGLPTVERDELFAAAGWPVSAQPTGAYREQLPTDTRLFTGRDEQVRLLLEAAEPGRDGSGPGVVAACVLDGMGGVGKTALAVHVAHRLAHRYPDGQLFLDLRGHDPLCAPLTVSEALGRLLRSLGVSGSAIPVDADERAALLRDRLHGTRTLLLLDNAESSAQVYPLLPADPGCLVLVTSRRRLTGLDDVWHLTVASLSSQDAVHLLESAVGPGRQVEDRAVRAELVDLCGRLPLAIRLVAARLRHHQALTAADLLARLRDDSTRLMHLAAEDRNLTAVFDTSYERLDVRQRRVLLGLALAPGEDAAADAVAALYGMETAPTDLFAVELLLEGLVERNLVLELTPGRYRLHDLVRAYAQVRAGAESAEDREASLNRLLEFYRRIASAAQNSLARATRPGAPARSADCDEGALDRLRIERANFEACIDVAIAAGDDERVLALMAEAAALWEFDGPYQLAVLRHSTAVSAARRVGDRLSEANAFIEIGRIHMLQSEYGDADLAYEQALTCYRALRSAQGEANVHQELGIVRFMQAHYSEARRYLQDALATFLSTGDELGEASARRELGRVAFSLSETEECERQCQLSAALYRKVGYLRGEALALNTLGRARHLHEDLVGAIRLYELSLQAHVTVGNRNGAAASLYDLGRAQLHSDRTSEGVETLERALALYHELGTVAGEALCLHTLGQSRQAMGEPAEAERLHRQALSINTDIGNLLGQANSLQALAYVRLEVGDLRDARDLFERSVSLAEQISAHITQANAIHQLGRIDRMEGLPDAALKRYNTSLEVFRRLRVPSMVAEILVDLADLLRERREAVQALRLYREAAEEADAAHLDALAARARDGLAACAGGIEEA